MKYQAAPRSASVRVLATALLVFLVGVIVTMALPAQAQAQADTADAPSPSVSLDGSFAFSEVGLTAVAPTAAAFGASITLGQSVGDVLDGVTAIPGAVVDTARDAAVTGVVGATRVLNSVGGVGGAITSGVKTTASLYSECAPTVPSFVIRQFTDTNCMEQVLDIAGSIAAQTASFAVQALYRSFTDFANRLWMWSIDLIFMNLLAGSPFETSAANDYQHGAAAPNLNSSWFTSSLGMSQQIALYLIAPFLLMVIIQSVIKGSLFFLVRAFTIMLPAAVIGGVAVVEFTRRLLWVSDDISQGIASQVVNVDQMRDLYANAANSFSADIFNLLVPFWLVVGFLAAIVIYIELLMRELGVYLSVFFIPLAFSAMVWPATAKFARRLVELLIGLIFSKVFIVAALTLGMAAMGDPGIENNSISTSFSQYDNFGQNGQTAGDAILDRVVNPAPTETDGGPAVNTAATGAAGTTGTAGATTGGGTAGSQAGTGPAQAGGGVKELNAITSGVFVFFMAAFFGSKIIQIAPGASSALEGRLGGAGDVLSKGHIASYASGKINQHFLKRRDSVTPKRADLKHVNPPPAKPQLAIGGGKPPKGGAGQTAGGTGQGGGGQGGGASSQGTGSNGGGGSGQSAGANGGGSQSRNTTGQNPTGINAGGVAGRLPSRYNHPGDPAGFQRQRGKDGAEFQGNAVHPNKNDTGKPPRTTGAYDSWLVQQRRNGNLD